MAFVLYKKKNIMIESFLTSKDVYLASALIIVVSVINYRIFIDKLKIYEILVTLVLAFCPFINIAVIVGMVGFIIFALLEEFLNKEV